MHDATELVEVTWGVKLYRTGFATFSMHGATELAGITWRVKLYYTGFVTFLCMMLLN